MLRQGNATVRQLQVATAFRCCQAGVHLHTSTAQFHHALEEADRHSQHDRLFTSGKETGLCPVADAE